MGYSLFDDKLINETYNMICSYHKKYLKKHNVKLPKLRSSQGYTKDALVLVRLCFDYPNTKAVSKEELTKFVKKYYPNVNDVQQARHLGFQKGWYIISGTRGDLAEEKIPPRTYKLVTLEKAHPSYIDKRRTGIETSDFEELKKEYDYRCACCGSKEGESHVFRKNVIIKLQQGHMNPLKDLLPGNIIPQCDICNRADRNRWIYDVTGRVIEVANTPDGFRVVLAYIKNADKETLKELYKEIEKCLCKK